MNITNDMQQIEYNVYCDESCHLENDHQPVMVIGTVWCPKSLTKKISAEIRELKSEHRACGELKWVKVSPAKVTFYQEVIKYFFDQRDLHFRGLVVSNKQELRHEDFGQDHDTWYYKMFFLLLNVILNPHSSYNIYLDVKDTRSSLKVQMLHKVLCSNMYDFSRDIIKKVQSVRSHEIEIVQLADLLIGAVCYANRDLKTSEAKLKIVEEIKKRSGYSLRASTLLREDKLNLFFWNPKEKTII